MQSRDKINNKKVSKSCVSSETKYYVDTLKTKPKKQNNVFFSKKNIILLTIFSVLSIVILVLTIRFVIQINWTLLSNAIKTGLSRKIGSLWFTLLILYFVWTIFSNYNMLLTRFKQYEINVSFWEYILFALTMSFLKCVTPATFVTDPYQIFWLKMHGMPTHLASSITFSNGLLWQIVQIVITTPSFILIMVNYQKLIYENGVSGAIFSQGLAILILACVGMGFDLISMTFMLLLNMSKKMHYLMSSAFNKIKKIFHMKYHTKAEIEEKYKNKAILKQDFLDFVKNGKYFSLTLLIFALNEIITYLALTWALYFVQNINVQGQIYQIKFNFWWAFNCTNVSFTANRLNILPNGAGGIEWILSVTLERMGGWIDPIKFQDPSAVHKAISNNAILVWRLFGGYIQGFIGLFAFVGILVLQTKSIKMQNKFVTTLLR